MTQSLTSSDLIKYGQSHGYSPKEINQVLKEAKNQLVDYGINAGYKGSEINKVLNTAGYDNYNPLTARANWQNLGANVARNAREFARDMRTIGGEVIRPFVEVAQTPEGQRAQATKDKFINAVNDNRFRRTAIGALAGAGVGSKLGGIGIAGGAIIGGLTGMLGPVGLTDAFLQPYETSTKEIGQVKEGKKSLGDLATDIMQGGMRNPLYSGIDVLSAGGLKGINAATKAIGKSIPANAPLVLQQLLPSPEMREFSRTGTNAFQAAKARNMELFEPLERLSSKLRIDNEELTRNLILNEGKLEGEALDIARQLKESIRKGERKAIEYGLIDAGASKNNVVAQYAMKKLMDTIPDLVHGDLVKYLETGELSPRMAEATLKNPELRTYLDDIISEGNKLYDNNKIAFVSEALSPTTDPRGEIIAREIAKQGQGYFGTTREIGRAKIEDLSKVLEDSIHYQQNQIARATEAIEVMDELLGQSGVAEIIKDAKNFSVPKGKTVINKRVLKEKLRDAIQAGSNVDVDKVLKDSHVVEQGAYLIPNVYFEALDNMFKPVGKGTGRDILSSFKKTVLASPHWFALNRIGNWTNNSMGGVKLTDYLDAVKNGDIMPKQLKQQTSFGSYVGDSALGFSSTVTTPIKNISKELKKFAGSDKSLSDIGRVAGQLVSNTSNIFSNPVFRLESAAEAIDRYSNFIRQAKREAKATKQDWKDIVKKADKDSELYNKLNTQVNKDLGDYVGRNYLLPNKAYEVLRETVPFYRFLTQTGRTSLHQLANHPIAFQSTVMAPTKAGRQYSEAVLQSFGLNPEDYEGGVPYKQQPDGTWRFIGTEPLPAGAVIGDLLSNTNKLNLLSPYYTTIPNIIAYKKGEGWTPTSPGLTEYKLAKGTTKGYEPTIKERYQYALSQLANTFYAPTRMTSTWGRELSNTILGRPTLSTYDTNIFQENPLSYAKTSPVETLGKWIGIQNRPYYPARIERPRKPSKSQIKKIQQYRQQYKQNTER